MTRCYSKVLSCCLVFLSAVPLFAEDSDGNKPSPDLKIELGPVSEHSVFASQQYSHWGGSLARSDDGQYRNNQRIGVAVADSPSGPWTRRDTPLIDVSDDEEAPDCLMTSNPSICRGPDGKFILIYKAVGKKFPPPNGGPVVHCVATSDSPTGPFQKQKRLVFAFEGERFPAEDPYVWYQAGKYRAIVKRIKHTGKKRVFSLVHYDSIDGLDWRPARHHEVSDRTLTWADGRKEQLDHVERPQVWLENGIPVALVCAADRIDENNVRQSFNVQIPLNVSEVEPLASMSVKPTENPFFVIAPDAKQRSVMCLRVEETAGGVAIEEADLLFVPMKPASIAIHPTPSSVESIKDGHVGSRRLIVTSTAKEDPSASALSIQTDGSIEFVGTSKLGHPSGYTSVDRSGRYFMTANYRTGTLAVYSISDDGMVGDETCSIVTPHPEAHCILTSPDNRFVYVPCVKNNNALFQYSFDSQTGQLRPLAPLDALPPKMFGPRHVAYHPTLPIAYFSNEQQLGVSAYTIRPDGQLTARQHASTMKRRSPFEQGKRDLHASDLVITPDGKRIFVAVRDFNGDEDSVFAFNVDREGKLDLLARSRVGDIPWKLDLSPGGRFLIVSEAFDHKLAVFKIQPDGKLSRAQAFDWGAEVRDMAVVAFP